MPRSKWELFHSVCAKAARAMRAYYQRIFGVRVSFTCSGCGDDFAITVDRLTAGPGAEVQAPSRCQACREGEGGDDDFRCVACGEIIGSHEKFWRARGGPIHDTCRDRLTIREWEWLKRD